MAAANLTEDGVLDWLGGQLARGRPYYEGGAVSGTRRQGSTLKARVHGSADAPYRVSVTLDDEGIADASCSCPVGGRRCKHVAAVLLAWLHEPDAFTDAEEVEASLQRRTKDELIALIRRMLLQEPDLESLLEVPLPTRKGKKTVASPEAYQKRAVAVFRNAGHDWDAASEVVGGLRDITAIGDEFLENEDFRAAAAVYRGVAAALAEHSDAVRDDEGVLTDVGLELAAGLSRCLGSLADDPEPRLAVLKSVLELYYFDLESEGTVLSEDVVRILLKETTSEERATLAGWVREEIEDDPDWEGSALGELLVDLQLDTLDDEAFLKLCEETDRTEELVGRLLDLGRTEEALRHLREATGQDLLALANLFVEKGHGPAAEEIVRPRAEPAQPGLLEWLKQRHAARGENPQALELAGQLFKMRPSLEGYRELRALSGRLGTWSELRPEILKELFQARRDLLIQIYLEEGEIDEAIAALKDLPKPAYGDYTGYLELQVAQAAEESRPEAALEIYKRQAERLIAQRGRENYVSACGYLRKARALALRLELRQTWDHYLANLRERNRHLSALKEELARAGL